MHHNAKKNAKFSSSWWAVEPFITNMPFCAQLSLITTCIHSYEMPHLSMHSTPYSDYSQAGLHQIGLKYSQFCYNTNKDLFWWFIMEQFYNNMNFTFALASLLFGRNIRWRHKNPPSWAKSTMCTYIMHPPSALVYHVSSQFPVRLWYFLHNGTNPHCRPSETVLLK